MSKILLIPDEHGRSFWKDAIDKYADECDKIIFLGDYVDPYPHEQITRKEAIKVLDEIIDFKINNSDKTILLIGNHDAHYFIDGFPRSSRYDSSNAYHIREQYSSHRGLFQLAYEEIIDGKRFLFTHAGLMNSWAERIKNVIGEPTVENLNNLANFKGGVAVLSDVSSYRSWMGYPSGSILWSDVREKISDGSDENNIMPNDDSVVPPYDYQIFGHTQLTNGPIITDKWACIDCREAFILDGEKLIECETEKKD